MQKNKNETPSETDAVISDLQRLQKPLLNGVIELNCQKKLSEIHCLVLLEGF